MNNEKILTPELLKERALKYAQTEEKVQVLGEIKECFSFRLESEWFLIETSYIEKVVEQERISRIPKMADFIKGNMNMRGEVILIVDMAMLLNLPATQVEEHSKIIILKIGDIFTGFPTDEVLGAVNLDTGAIQKSISTIKGVEAEYINGLFTHEDKHFAWLDIEKVLSEMESRLFTRES